MSEPLVRAARREDLDQILELYRDLHDGDERLSPERAQSIWSDLESNPACHVIVAELDGRIVSSCVLAVIPNLTRGGRSFGLIENVVTGRAHRGRGIGSVVMRHALALAWEQGCYKVMLLTSRPSAWKFYESVGFVRGTKTGFVALRPTT